MCCGKVSRGSWYRIMDIYINPGAVVHERACKKCVISFVGPKNKRLKEILGDG